VKQEIVAAEATISQDEDVGATPKAEILPELQNDRAAPTDLDLQAKTVPEMQHCEPIPPVINRALRIVFFRSNRISNRIGRPIRFRIESSNLIGRIYHASRNTA